MSWPQPNMQSLLPRTRMKAFPLEDLSVPLPSPGGLFPIDMGAFYFADTKSVANNRGVGGAEWRNPDISLCEMDHIPAGPAFDVLMELGKTSATPAPYEDAKSSDQTAQHFRFPHCEDFRPPRQEQQSSSNAPKAVLVNTKPCWNYLSSTPPLGSRATCVSLCLRDFQRGGMLKSIVLLWIGSIFERHPTCLRRMWPGALSFLRIPLNTVAAYICLCDLFSWTMPADAFFEAQSLHPGGDLEKVVDISKDI